MTTRSQVSVVLLRNMFSLALYEMFQEYLASIPLGDAFYQRPLAIQCIFLQITRENAPVRPSHTKQTFKNNQLYHVQGTNR